MKKAIIFIISLIFLFMPCFIKINFAFYNSLLLPFFTPSNTFFIVSWSIVYTCIAISITKVLSNYSFKEVPKSYQKILIINYLFNESFIIFFFIMHSPFLGFVSSIGTFISCLFLYEETTNLEEKAIKYLNPYVLLSFFASVLSLCIYIMNF